MIYEQDISGEIEKKSNILIRSDEANYFDDASEQIVQLMKKKKVILVNFELDLRLLFIKIEMKNANIDDLKIVDCISIIKGKGTPPVPGVITVSKPNSFNDIQVYINLFITKVQPQNAAIVFLSLHNLREYSDEDEIGMFMNVVKDQSIDQEVPVMIIENNKMTFVLAQILSRLVKRVIPLRGIDAISKRPGVK